MIYQVLVTLKENYPSDKFYITIRQYHSVNAFYTKLCRTVQMGSVEQIYEQEDNFNAQAMLSVRDSYRAKVLLILYFSNRGLLTERSQQLENRLAVLTTAVKQYRQGKNEIAATLAEDQIKLLKAQKGYETKHGCPSLDFSLNDTLKLLMRLRDWKETEEMVKKFKIPERRYVNCTHVVMCA